MSRRTVCAHVPADLSLAVLALLSIQACSGDVGVVGGHTRNTATSTTGPGAGGASGSGSTTVGGQGGDTSSTTSGVGTTGSGGTSSTTSFTSGAGGTGGTLGTGGGTVGSGTGGRNGTGGAGGTGGRSGTGSGGAGGAGGGGGKGGSGGSGGNPGQCIYPPTASQRKAPEFTLPAPANPSGIILRLMNNCPQTLWVQAAGIPGGSVELAGRVAGQPPAEKVFDWPGLSGRMNVFENSANGYNINFLEMNASRQALNVNNSNVDWVGLPVEVRGDDRANCLTACYTPLAHMMDGCPPQLLDATHHVCTAPKNWCANAANANNPLCTALDAAGAAVIANDPKCKSGGSISAAGTGWKIYGCAGNGGTNFWNQNPYCCAEVNRGYLTDVNDPANDLTQNCNYYKQMPFNTYALYAQTVCPYVYAFPFDDVNNQSGFQTCANAREMDVTWCPGDP
jgi:hypothetical protein